MEMAVTGPATDPTEKPTIQPRRQGQGESSSLLRHAGGHHRPGPGMPDRRAGDVDRVRAAARQAEPRRSALPHRCSAPQSAVLPVQAKQSLRRREQGGRLAHPRHIVPSASDLGVGSQDPIRPTVELACTRPPNMEGPPRTMKVRQMAAKPIRISRADATGEDCAAVAATAGGVIVRLRKRRSRTVALRAASSSRPSKANARGAASPGKPSRRKVRSMGMPPPCPDASTQAELPAQRMVRRSAPAGTRSPSASSRSPISIPKMRRTLFDRHGGTRVDLECDTSGTLGRIAIRIGGRDDQGGPRQAECEADPWSAKVAGASLDSAHCPHCG